MKKEKILKNIKEAIGTNSYRSSGANSMGVCENFYNPDYLIGKCFTEKKLSAMDESTLNNLVKLAEFASDAFY